MSWFSFPYLAAGHLAASPEGSHVTQLSSLPVSSPDLQPPPLPYCPPWRWTVPPTSCPRPTWLWSTWTPRCQRTPSSPRWRTPGATCWTITPSSRSPPGGPSSSTSSSTSCSACPASFSSSCPSCRSTRSSRLVVIWALICSFNCSIYSFYKHCVSVCAGQTRDVGEAVEMFPDAPVQSLLHPAAIDLWNLLLHWVFQHSIWLGLHAPLVRDTVILYVKTHNVLELVPH